ncbi:MAG TPA: ATP-binding cassette domain-containing protein [Verrucomicrobiota bacterium]|nr:ATP-binding cassette domain-containing protein [Verrucomicrobiota bacterium]HNT15650.1 ATP-binding cassette domain-containing protein [Verrucomicrobiota bacterium]
MAGPQLVNAKATTGAAPLEVRGVTKLFGGFRAVDDVSFQLPAGAIYGFLGPNGAGKTTTIRMILEIIKPTSGSITVLGASSALQVRQRIGYLPEEKGLYKKMKNWAVIAYFATLKGLSRAAAKRRAFELLERYGLKDFATKPTEALSKGMGQKVQMLASIAHDPEFVILDEPFSGLDPVNQQVMEDIIRDMAGRGRTILFSTHVMQHAERLCDRILLLAKGRKIFDGTVAEAQRTLPRRVRIETADNIAPLTELPEVAAVRPLPPTSDDREGPVAAWEVELRGAADPQAVLQACFVRGIRLRSFNQSEPTLHEVFMRLVGPEAREVAAR